MTNEIEHSGVVAVGDTAEAIIAASDAQDDRSFGDLYQSGSVAMGDSREDGQCPRPCNGRPDDFSMRSCIEAGECGCIAFPARPAQEPVAYRAADPDGDGYIYLDRDKTVDVYRKAGVQFTPLYAAPQPVINPTHSQVAGTPGLLTDPAPSDHVGGKLFDISEIIAALEETYSFAASSRRSQENINFVLEQLQAQPLYTTTERS